MNLVLPICFHFFFNIASSYSTIKSISLHTWEQLETENCRMSCAQNSLFRAHFRWPFKWNSQKIFMILTFSLDLLWDSLSLCVKKETNSFEDIITSYSSLLFLCERLIQTKMFRWFLSLLMFSFIITFVAMKHTVICSLQFCHAYFYHN